MLDITISMSIMLCMPKKQHKPKRFSDQIREAVDSSGQSRYAIWIATGISQPTLSRFMAGERGLPMKTLDTLAEYLGFRLVVDPKPKPTKRKTKGS